MLSYLCLGSDFYFLIAGFLHVSIQLWVTICDLFWQHAKIVFENLNHACELIMDSLCKDTFCTCTACHADINRNLIYFRNSVMVPIKEKNFHMCVYGKKNREAQASVFFCTFVEHINLKSFLSANNVGPINWNRYNLCTISSTLTAYPFNIMLKSLL